MADTDAARYGTSAEDYEGFLDGDLQFGGPLPDDLPDLNEIGDVMVTISLKLPLETLAAVKAAAATRTGGKHTVLIRQWVEQALAELAAGDRKVSYGDVLRAIAQLPHTA